jgi:hypothetical protein
MIGIGVLGSLSSTAFALEDGIYVCAINKYVDDIKEVNATVIVEGNTTKVSLKDIKRGQFKCNNKIINFPGEQQPWTWSRAFKVGFDKGDGKARVGIISTYVDNTNHPFLYLEQSTTGISLCNVSQLGYKTYVPWELFAPCYKGSAAAYPILNYYNYFASVYGHVMVIWDPYTDLYSHKLSKQSKRGK